MLISILEGTEGNGIVMVLLSKTSLSYHKPDCPVASRKSYEDARLEYPFYSVELETALKMKKGRRNYTPCPRCLA